MPAEQITTPWETYAHKIIAGLCLAAWREANTTSTSKRRKKHQPYSAPEMARALTAALGLHDATERERTVKALLLEHNYRVSVGARE